MMDHVEKIRITRINSKSSFVRWIQPPDWSVNGLSSFGGFIGEFDDIVTEIRNFTSFFYYFFDNLISNT